MANASPLHDIIAFTVTRRTDNQHEGQFLCHITAGGRREVRRFRSAAGATIAQLLEEMIRRYPALRQELLNEQNELYQHVHIFVNGRDVTFLEWKMDTPLAADDAIGVFPAIGGG